MVRCELLTTWTSERTFDIATRFPGVGFTDVTGQRDDELPTAPPLLIVEVTCDEATWAQIEADSGVIVLRSTSV